MTVAASVCHGDRQIRYRAHPKDEARVPQGTIVENKRLGEALGWIAERQRRRDIERLANPQITLRAKKRIRAAAGMAP